MGFAVGQIAPWTVVPDWSTPVRETLAWRTEIQRAKVTGVSYHLAKRDTPARSFDFSMVFDKRSRRVADALMAARSGQDMLLPIWPDAQQLAATLVSGATAIACATAGYDFAAGGKALLWASEKVFEVVSVATVGAGVLNLSAPTASAWPAGTRLYPLRLARARMEAKASALSDEVGSMSIAFDVREPCAWPAVAPATSYLGRPVLTQRPNESEGLAHGYERLIEEVGNELGDPEVFDLAGVLLRRLQLDFLLAGRAEHTAWRSLLYALRGAATPVWLPSWRQDLKVTAPIGSAATTITVDWGGYTALQMLAPGRRDIRIELADGTAWHRRITAAAEAGENETLTINAALGASVDPSAIRAVSFIVLACASDACEITHLTDADGLATSSLAFSAVVPDA